MTSIEELRENQSIYLYDPDSDQYVEYIYRFIDMKHHFIPLDEENYCRRRFTNLRDALNFDAMINGSICSDYVVPQNCYLYNSYSYPNVSIVPVESVFSFIPNDMGEFEEDKMASIERAIFLPPIDVRQVGNRYEIINGNHRRRFSIARGYTHIPVRIH
jgi:hypothetical protein